MPRPELAQIDLACADMEKTFAFYRLLGLEIAEEAVWRTASGAHHIHLDLPNGMSFGLNSVPLAHVYNAGQRGGVRGGSVVIGFTVESRAAVDALYGTMTAAGHPGLQPPWDAFWGARYAIVEDPDGNPVGIMSPVDPAKRWQGPDL